jgi:hypothetical protein
VTSILHTHSPHESSGPDDEPLDEEDDDGPLEDDELPDEDDCDEESWLADEPSEKLGVPEEDGPEDPCPLLLTVVSLPWESLGFEPPLPWEPLPLGGEALPERESGSELLPLG